MEISGVNSGIGVQGIGTFSSLETQKDQQGTTNATGDRIEISEEAKKLYSLMQSESSEDLSNMSPEELEAYLAENPEAANTEKAAKGDKPPPPPPPKESDSEEDNSGGSGTSVSTDSTSTETSLEADILDIEMQIAQAEEEAEKTGNTSKVDQLKSELEDLEEELDELTEA